MSFEQDVLVYECQTVINVFKQSIELCNKCESLVF